MEARTINFEDTIFDTLNGQQRQAVADTEGPCLIVAGAGSGKTRVLTTRIAYMLSKGVEAERILALTFTKKAAGEMKERIAGMVGLKLAHRLYMGTFHSVFIRILRDYADCLGYPAKFTIYDTSDSQTVVKDCLKELNLDDKVYKPKEILSRISLIKNALCTPEEYKHSQEARGKRWQQFSEVFELYQKKLKTYGVMDFDDILMNMCLLLNHCDEARENVPRLFDYVLVDEYQDTNMAQYQAIRLLCMNHRNICVVGDDSQSIYGFRGARIENILGFQKDFPEAKVYRLEQNYRSTQNIVNAANSLIVRNNDKIPKTCFSEGDKGDKIRLIHAFNEQDEARLIASIIVSRLQDDHAQYQDFAVLYRMNAQSRAIEEALRARNLPYIVYSGHSFFDRAEVKDMMGYFKLCANPSDDEAFRRVIGKPARGIGDTTIGLLAMAAEDHETTLMQAIGQVELDKYGIKAPAGKRLMEFKSMIMKYNAMLETRDASIIAEGLANESGLYAFYKNDNSVEGQSRTANVDELLNSISAFIESKRSEYREEFLLEHGSEDMDEASLPVVTLGEWLESISLLSSVDVDEEEDAANRVKLMTAHSSKGLEFPYVIVAGMEEGIFPGGRDNVLPQDVEEERRLFYVAMTRTQQALFLSYCDTRMHNGKPEQNHPSRFLNEIAPEYIDNPLPSSKNGVERTYFRSYSDRARGGYAQKRDYSSRSESRFRTAKQLSGLSDAPSQSSQTSTHFGRSPIRSSRPLHPSTDFAGSPRSRPAHSSSNPSFEISSPLDFRQGQRVEHSKFGTGTVTEVYGERLSLKARVNFDAFGEKILLLNYAKMRIIR